MQVIVQAHHHRSFCFVLQIFTFSIYTMFSLIPSDANDPQGLSLSTKPLCPPVPLDKVKFIIKELFPDTLKIHQFNICSESGRSSISGYVH